MKITLSPLDRKTHETWNRFVSEAGAFYTVAHNPSLGDILFRTFGMENRSLLIYSEDKLLGVFPLCLAGGKLVSMPHFSYGGILVTPETRMQDLYSDVLGNMGNKYEIRSFQKISDFYNDEKVASYLELKGSAEEQMKSFKSKLRSQIKKGLTNELMVRNGGMDLLEDYYSVYSRNMHEIGSPVLGKDFFINLLKYYEHGSPLVFCVYYNEIPVGASFVLTYLRFAEVCWASTVRKFNFLQTNMVLYWEMIRWSIENEMSIFSFGRSTKGSTTHRFKMQWDTCEKTLFFNYSEQRKMDIKKARIFSKMWQLLPYSVANILGPSIAARIY